MADDFFFRAFLFIRQQELIKRVVDRGKFAQASEAITFTASIAEFRPRSAAGRDDSGRSRRKKRAAILARSPPRQESTFLHGAIQIVRRNLAVLFEQGFNSGALGLGDQRILQLLRIDGRRVLCQQWDAS